MSRSLAAALLNVPAVTAIVGARRALKQLPAGTALPALVYTVVDINPTEYVNDGGGYEAMRVQVNPLASTVAGVQTIHDAVRGALDGLAHVTIASRRVIRVRADVIGPEDQTTDGAGAVVWTWPADYIVVFE